MTIMSMVDAAKVPVGSAGSLFADPNAASLQDYNDVSDRFSSLFPQVPNLDDVGAALGGVSAATTSYTTDKLSRITTEIPMMQAVSASAASAEQATKLVDSTVAPADSDKTIDDAFPTGAEAPTGCPSFNDAFKALTEGVKDAFDNATEGIKDAYDSMSAKMKEIIESVMGPIRDAKEFLKKLKETAKLELLKIKAKVMAALDPLIEGAKEMLDDLKTTIKGVTDKVNAAINDFKDMVTEELNAIKDAMKFLTDFNFLKMFKITNPCVRELMGKVTNAKVVDQAAIEVIDKPATTIDTPTTNAIEIANSGRPLGGLPPIDNKVAPTDDIDNRYTKEELSAFYVEVQSFADALQKQKAAVAKWVKVNIEDWKVEWEFNLTQARAGASDANPYGTTTDPDLKELWKVMYEEYLNLTNRYNTDILDTLKRPQMRYDEFLSEYNARKTYGKTPYTTLARKGHPVPADQQYTNLDWSK